MSFFDRSREKLDALTRLIHTVAGATNTDVILTDVLAQITELLQADRATLYFLDHSTGELWSKVALGEGKTLEIRVKIGKGLAGWVGMTGVPLVINDVIKDDRFDARWDKKSGYRTERVLCVPVLDVEQKVTGVLQVLNKRRGDFNELDKQLLVTIADVCAMAIEIAALRTATLGRIKEA